MRATLLAALTSRRGTAVAGLVGSVAVLAAVPATWSASLPPDTAGSRAAVATSLAGSATPGGTATRAATGVPKPLVAEPAPPASGPPAAGESAPGLWVAAPTAPAPPAPAPPVEVDIAGIGVVAAIDAVGVSGDGSMVIPRDAHRVGWYRHGAAPGSASGSAVIAGHVDSRRQGRGAMFELRNVQVGDPVRVRLADGTVLGYRIIARELLAKAALPLTELFSRAGPHRLTLITCGGDYDPATGGYQDNVVVTAVPDALDGSALAGGGEGEGITVRTPGVA